MGFGTFELTSTINYVAAHGIIPVNPGMLYAISAFSVDDFHDSATAYIELGITTNSTDRYSRQIVLAGGNAGSDVTLFWTGQFPIEVDDYISILARSMEGTKWRVNYRIVPTAKEV